MHIVLSLKKIFESFFYFIQISLMKQIPKKENAED